MAVIFNSAILNVSADEAWAVVERFMRGEIRVFSFVEDIRLEGDVRVVVSDVLEQPEQNITVDSDLRYASYTLLTSPYWQEGYHHGSMRVFDTEGDGRCRFEWMTDFAPDALAALFPAEFIEVLWSELVHSLETGEDASPVSSVDVPLPQTAAQ